MILRVCVLSSASCMGPGRTADMLEKDGKNFREVFLAWFKHLRELSTFQTEDGVLHQDYYSLVIVAYNGFSTDFRHLLKQCDLYEIDLEEKLEEANVSLLMDTFDAIVKQDHGFKYLKSLGWDETAEKAQSNSYLCSFLTKEVCPKAHRAQVDAEMTYKVAEHESIAPLLFYLPLEQQQSKRKSTIPMKDFIYSVRQQQKRKSWEKSVKKGLL